jgi:hypothetical protein
MQNDDQGNEKPVAYMSQSLFDDEFKYSFIQKHAFALVKVVEKFRQFILGKHIVMGLIGKCEHKQISLDPPRSRTKHNRI